MPVHNSDIAALFREMADLLAIEDANRFRIRAYREAANTIERLPRPVREMLTAGEDLTELAGIGDDLAEKIKEIVKTGTFTELKALEKGVAPSLAELMHIPGLGPKRVSVLHEKLGIVTKDDLKVAAEAGRIHSLEGFGKKLEQQILEGLAGSDGNKRILLHAAEEFAESILRHLRALTATERATIAGSYRRRKETVGDIDILATSLDPDRVIGHFTSYDDVKKIISEGTTRSSVLLKSGLQVDLRVVDPKSYGAAMLYLTGSKAHNIRLRSIAQDKGWKINEYGVFEGESYLAGKTETDIYGLFGMDYIEPELREDRGELSAAKKGTLPELIILDDIRGDLHTHTTDSDGRHSLEEMAGAAKKRGYAYLAITDHSPALAVTRGLDARALASQIKAIDRLNARLKGFYVIKAIEVDILEDGSLDLPNDILRELDLRVCSIHSRFNLSEQKQTERIIRAMDNPLFNILAHPTGRLIGQREPYAVNIERIMKAALDRGCFLEVNAQPLRLDLNDAHIKLAKDMGLKLAISTDAHWSSELDWMRYGIGQARRGWLEAGDVLNTNSWSTLKKLLKR